MLGSIYAGYSGLTGFSKGLDVLSNNVANMNSYGFKVSEATFRDLVYRHGVDGEQSSQIGSGMDMVGTRLNFSQGDFAQSANELDAAINGVGFFVLRKDGETFYTRAGQFDIDQDGFLIDKVTQARVAGLTDGNLHNINISELSVNQFRPTSTIEFAGNLTRSGTTVTHDINAITVFDGEGRQRTLSMHFTSNGTTTSGGLTVHVWLVEISENGNVIANGDIQYRSDGLPAADNSITFDLAPASGGSAVTAITLNFGAEDSITGSTNFSGNSDLFVLSQDGFPAGALVESTFDADGVLTLTYSNGQTVRHERLALAWFSDLQLLTQVGNSLFARAPDQEEILGNPGEGIFGSISARSVERANVDLTEQFTNMVVIQRGYQASAQIISVANEMIQQLLDIRNRR